MVTWSRRRRPDARTVIFDPDDIDAAFEELDARYLAGEAAAYAHTWSLIIRAYAAFNRREFPATTPDWVNIDHRRGTAFAPGDLIAILPCRVGPRAARSTSTSRPCIGSATSERWSPTWRGVPRKRASRPSGGMIDLLTFEGDLISRCEIFDEADLDAALARFDELSRPAPQLENAATRV